MVAPKPIRILRRLLRACCEQEAAQIVELAVSLPLLAVLFVTTYDFGEAFNIKQKLVMVTREAARFASNQPTSDLTNANAGCKAPLSVCAVRDLIDQLLVSEKVPDCGLGAAQAGSSTAWSWEFDASSGCSTPFVVVINRGFTYPSTSVKGGIGGGRVTVTVEATQVNLSYPYHWQFNQVVKLLGTNSNYGAVTTIHTSATMQNLN